MARIALIDVGTWSPGFHGRLSSLDPLGMEYLGGTLVKHGYDVELFQKRDSLEKLVYEVGRINVDMVCISSLTCDTYDAFKVAHNFSSINPWCQFFGNNFNPGNGLYFSGIKALCQSVSSNSFEVGDNLNFSSIKSLCQCVF